MYSDQTIAFLSQSTEVPNFRKAKLAAPVSKFALAASQLYEREQSSSPEGKSDSVPGTIPLEASESVGEGSMSGSDVDFGDDDDDGNEAVDQATGGLNGKRMDRLRSDALFNYPVFAAGRVYTDSLMELLMAQAYFNPTEISFWEALLGIEDFDKVFNACFSMSYFTSAPFYRGFYITHFGLTLASFYRSTGTVLKWGVDRASPTRATAELAVTSTIRSPNWCPFQRNHCNSLKFNWLSI